MRNGLIIASILGSVSIAFGFGIQIDTSKYQHSKIRSSIEESKMFGGLTENIDTVKSLFPKLGHPIHETITWFALEAAPSFDTNESWDYGSQKLNSAEEVRAGILWNDDPIGGLTEKSFTNKDGFDDGQVPGTPWLKRFVKLEVLLARLGSKKQKISDLEKEISVLRQQLFDATKRIQKSFPGDNELYRNNQISQGTAKYKRELNRKLKKLAVLTLEVDKVEKEFVGPLRLESKVENRIENILQTISDSKVSKKLIKLSEQEQNKSQKMGMTAAKQKSDTLQPMKSLAKTKKDPIARLHENIDVEEYNQIIDQIEYARSIELLADAMANLDKEMPLRFKLPTSRNETGIDLELQYELLTELYGLRKVAKQLYELRSFDVDMLYSSHFGDLQYLHSMGSQNESREQIKSKIMNYVGFVWDIASGVTKIQNFRALNRKEALERLEFNRAYQASFVNVQKVKAGLLNDISLQDAKSEVAVKSFEMANSLTQFRTRFKVTDRSFHTRNGRALQFRALGSILHLVQDSFAKGHTVRQNWESTYAGQGPSRQAYDSNSGAIRYFQDYSKQKGKCHSHHDSNGHGTENGWKDIPGALQALELSTKISEFFSLSCTWEEAASDNNSCPTGGMKAFFDQEVFPLVPIVDLEDLKIAHELESGVFDSSQTRAHPSLTEKFARDQGCFSDLDESPKKGVIEKIKDFF
ncbi:MAG: hypothetical protein AB8E15_11805 [Bdellovibrionales bacterium]